MKKIFVGVMLFLCTVVLFAGGTLTESRISMVPPQRITLAWVADTNGNVAVTSQYVRGTMYRAQFVVGTRAPTNATYAVTLKDTEGIDMLNGQGAAIATNVSGTATEVYIGVTMVSTTGITNFFPGIVINDKLALSISGVGTSAAPASGKQGSVILYLK